MDKLREKIIFPILGLMLAFLTIFIVGCEKKDRLASSTFDFSITPSAKAVVIGDTQTFQIVSSINSDPTWTISASSVGALSTSIGPTVVFTASDYGDARIYATFNGVTAVAQVTVVASYAPGASGILDLYSDAGLPTGSDIDSDIFVTPPKTPSIIYLVEKSDGVDWTPEGIRFQRIFGSPGANPTWGITFDDDNSGNTRNLDASFFDVGKNLKFWVKLHRSLDVGGGESIGIKLESPGDPATVFLSFAGHGFVPTVTDWQEISVPLTTANFDVDHTKIKVPFTMVLQGLTSPLTLDVDAVRWE